MCTPEDTTKTTPKVERNSDSSFTVTLTNGEMIEIGALGASICRDFSRISENLVVSCSVEGPAVYFWKRNLSEEYEYMGNIFFHPVKDDEGKDVGTIWNMVTHVTESGRKYAVQCFIDQAPLLELALMGDSIKEGICLNQFKMVSI
jgi:hypothetical protein